MPNGEQLLLAIDTSTETAGLALYDGDSISELVWQAGRNQTSTLLPEMHRLLELNRRTVRDIRAVGVAIGPGTFNGLRVGLSLAKGLCFGLQIPIVGVSTLDVVAYPFTGPGDQYPIRACVPAGRGRAVFADYRYRNGQWGRLGDLRNERFDQLLTALVDRTIIAGELPAEVAERLSENPLAIVPSPALRLRRPSCLADVAFRRWEAGDVDRLEALEPVYVHGNPAVATGVGASSTA